MRWEAYKNPDGESTADSIDVIEKLIKDKAGAEVEETADGCWTSPGCKRIVLLLVMIC